MKTIALLNSTLLALVDDEDHQAVASFGWYAYRQRNIIYARRQGAGAIPLHLFIAARAGLPRASVLDHRNRNGLDNQRGNLRPATHAQNGWNCIRKFGASGFPGVHKNRGHWAVRFDHMGSPVYFGTHRQIDDAKAVAATEILRLKGEFLPPELRALLVAELERSGRCAA